MPAYTVFAVLADTEESCVQFVEAADLAGAKSAAYRSAPGVILIAGVAFGHIAVVPEAPTNVTPLRDHEAFIEVSSVRVARRSIAVPSKCPACRIDFRLPGNLEQHDLTRRVWDGHLARDGSKVAAQVDQSALTLSANDADAVVLVCSMCRHYLWDGVNHGRES